MQQCDVAIIGGGIVGLATAYRMLERFPHRRVMVLEKERQLAQHQTGHNSGVLHSGIYYRPGSLRAINCRDGKLALQQFCDQEQIPYQLCGKVIVATGHDEIPQLQQIYERGRASQIPCELIDQARLRELEPHVNGVQAIHVPGAGIVDYRQIAERFAKRIEERGGEIWTSARVVRIHEHHGLQLLQTARGDIATQLIVNCAGLQSDRVTRLTGLQPPARIVPFRGEYYELKPSSHALCRGLVYPVPDPTFPFLGVHFTRMIHGGIECGPNAVLAFAREGYFKTSFNLRDFFESVTYLGFRNLAWKHWDAGWAEFYRSWSKRAFVEALQKLIPEIRAEELVPAPAGIRAQALMPNGDLVDDFLIESGPRVINVCNAPSPAATASLNIGRLIVDRIADRLA